MKRSLKRLGFLVRFHKSVPFFVAFFKSREVGVLRKILFVALIIGYSVFPFDVIPDFLIVFGVVDDVAVAAWILQYMVKTAPKSLRDQYGLNS
ncbi:YkvA family protein [Lentibacillus saliphilus]|uniref:YkvA family protein n=1 Tax=Lentibacillus saliphilus TaxID=2737028 RepID=UPI001C3104A0|nr:DUF1232 domain-containing protein [Lentibacillus saliphilus]